METIINLWPKNRLVKENGNEIKEHNITRTGDELIAGRKVMRLADITDPTIQIFKPRKPNGAAVIVCPGGGYTILAMDLEGSEICSWLNTMGITAILLKYRVPATPGRSRYELPLQDAQRAMGLVRFHAKKWHINPNRIGIMGFSAGAHLSAALSNNFSKRNYPYLDDADNVSCKPDFTILIYPAYLKQDAKPDQLAPEVQVSAVTPPTFIVQTEDDFIDVQNSLTYYLELKKFKVPVEMHLYSKGGHGYGIRVKGQIGEYPNLLQNWLKDGFK